MKKINLFLMGILALSLSFVGCKSTDDDPNVDNNVEDGFYVVGEATAVTDLTVDGASKAIMAAGINEVTKTVRTGMYAAMNI